MKKRWFNIGYQVDRLLISSFIPPFFMSFMIAVFVLIMQFLWRYIDDIIGKGADLLVVVELIFYKSVSLFPLALPISVLLAAVMIMGNMAERYELSSFKSAGVSLLRLMAPLIGVSMLIGLFSFYCSNTMIPIANLKYQSRLYDIKNQKPTLSIEPGVFNEDFKGFAIRVGKKLNDKETIEDIMVYDDTQRNRGQMNVVTAQRGKMYVSDGAFVMTLYDGYQYAEMETRGKPDQLPFSISHFKEWTRKFNLNEFDLDRTEEDQFKSHHLMKSARQIAIEVDTLDVQIAILKSSNKSDYKLLVDSVAPEVYKITSGDTSFGVITFEKNLKARKLPVKDPLRSAERFENISMVFDSLHTEGDKSVSAALPAGYIRKWKSELISSISVKQSQIDRNERSIERLELTRRKHVYQLHWKFSLALACVVMMMIGGPMGTIVRKGGFGYPLIVSIFFFTFFIMSNITTTKLNDSKTLNPVLAAWLPVMLLGCISILLTYKALNDAKIMDLDRIKVFIARLGRKPKVKIA